METLPLLCLFLSIHTAYCWGPFSKSPMVGLGNPVGVQYNPMGLRSPFLSQFTDNLAGYGPSSRVVRLTRDSNRFIPAICTMPCIQSDCRKKETRWKYDLVKGGCRKFKGCVGSGNNFPTEDSCEDLCEDQDDPCKKVKCRRCEICDAGRCFWDDTLCPPEEPSCGASNCGGPCNYCDGSRCRRRRRCITIGRTDPPPTPPRADPCAGVICRGMCQTCLMGQCVPIPFCAPPRPRCRTRCRDPCQRCRVNQCVPIRSPMCAPAHLPAHPGPYAPAVIPVQPHPGKVFYG
jgi:hypothetical protein